MDSEDNPTLIAVYADHRGLTGLIKSYLLGTVHRTTDRRKEFDRWVGDAQVGLVGTLDCTPTLVRHLKSVLRLEAAGGPSCIVVTRVSFDNLRNLREIECDRLHVVWVEEIEECLPQVLDKAMRPAGADGRPPGEAARDDPLRTWGLSLLSEHSLRPAMVKTVRLICGLLDDHTGPPFASVAKLAKRVGVEPSKLGYLWKAEIPLRCTVRPMLHWSVLLWAIRHWNDAPWKDVAHAAGVKPRTLQRYSQSLARCALRTAAADPAHVRRRFDEWLSGVTVE
jgi:hypothetical protein